MTSSGSTPGNAMSISTSRSVSSTSMGGSQLGSLVGRKLRNCWCNRSARASVSMALDSIQLMGSLVDMRLSLEPVSESDSVPNQMTGIKQRRFLGRCGRNASPAIA
jgi:hypothetical protein